MDNSRPGGVRAAIVVLCLVHGIVCTATGEDSLRVKELAYDIEAAEVRVEATSLWRRILPSIHLSASFGMKDALVYDPTTSVLYPRDAYRLTISIPLHELFRSEQHQEAAIRLRRLRDEKEMTEKELAAARQRQLDHTAAVRREVTILSAELHLLREIVSYNELLFQQGKIPYDVLARARLQVLQTQRQILHLDSNPERATDAMDRM
jgi:outer membrane protein TolC